MEPSPRLNKKFEKPTIQYIMKGRKLPKFFTVPDELKIEYFSDKFYDLPAWEQVEILHNLHITQPTRRKIGVLFAGVLAEDPKKVVVGFSLCHNTMDEFDMTNTGTLRKVKGLGLQIAMGNALRWSNKKYVMEPTQSPFSKIEYLEIPEIVVNNKHSNLLNFLIRIKKRYKGKVLPEWCEHMLKVCNVCDCGCQQIEQDACQHASM
jgi:hypothetical protein